MTSSLIPNSAEQPTPRLRRRSRPTSADRNGAAAPRLATAIEHVAITVPIPYPGNARRHDDRQMAKLAEIIRQVGFQAPMLLDDESTIIAGHGRWLAAKQLGLTQVPVIRVSHLSPDQVKAFRIADNRLAELSSWDDTALAIELKQLVMSLEDPEIIELTSFEIGEIDARLTILEDKQEEDPADAVVAPAADASVSRWAICGSWEITGCSVARHWKKPATLTCFKA